MLQLCYLINLVANEHFDNVCVCGVRLQLVEPGV